MIAGGRGMLMTWHLSLRGAAAASGRGGTPSGRGVPSLIRWSPSPGWGGASKSWGKRVSRS